MSVRRYQLLLASTLLVLVAGCALGAREFVRARESAQQRETDAARLRQRLHAAREQELAMLGEHALAQCNAIGALRQSASFLSVDSRARLELLVNQLDDTDRFLAFDGDDGVRFESAYANLAQLPDEASDDDSVELGRRAEHCLSDREQVRCIFANSVRPSGTVLRLQARCGGGRVVLGVSPNAALSGSLTSSRAPESDALGLSLPTAGAALVLLALLALSILVFRYPQVSPAAAASQIVDEGASVQMLARHLAHEVKNPLMPIRMSIETVRRVKERAHPEFDRIFDESTQMVLGEVQRLERLATQFSELGGPLQPRRAPTRVQDVLSYVVQLHSPKKDSGTTFTDHPDAVSVRAIPSGELQANVDSELLKQALVNLVKNAREAIAPQRSGTVRLSVRQHEKFVVVDIEDTGPGFSDQRTSAVEPYVSTKVGGSGIGLLMVRRIAAAHGGRIEITSSKDLGGAKVCLYLVRD